MGDLRLDLTQLAGYLERAGREAVPTDWSGAWPVVGMLAVADTKANFARQSDPYGNPWAPLLHPSRRRGSSPQILRDTGVLLASIAVGPTTATSLEYGTAVDYGAYHQHGTRKMAARPFLGFGEALTRKIGLAMGEFVEKWWASQGAG